MNVLGTILYVPQYLMFLGLIGNQAVSLLGRFWRQVGGHLRIVECNSLGVVWGIGYDHTAWVHTGGYGGGIFQGKSASIFIFFNSTCGASRQTTDLLYMFILKISYCSYPGLSSSTDNIYTQTDVKNVYIYENQRWNPVTGYTNR